MEDVSDGLCASAQYALVSDIPDPLGDFLNRLREELLPSCRLLSHITLLPPRILMANPAMLERAFHDAVRLIPPFSVELGPVEVFDDTDVVYLSVKRDVGEHIQRIHDHLNQGLLKGEENFPFHPHVTLAQEIPDGRLKETVELATRRWQEWAHNRSFRVDTLTFVRNVDPNTWMTVAEGDLHQPAA